MVSSSFLCIVTMHVDTIMIVIIITLILLTLIPAHYWKPLFIVPLYVSLLNIQEKLFIATTVLSIKPRDCPFIIVFIFKNIISLHRGSKHSWLWSNESSSIFWELNQNPAVFFSWYFPGEIHWISPKFFIWWIVLDLFHYGWSSWSWFQQEDQFPGEKKTSLDVLDVFWGVN